MKSYAPLIKAFRRLDTSVNAWHKSSMPLAKETINAILSRELPVSAAKLAYLCKMLDMTHGEIIDVLRAYAAENKSKANEVNLMVSLISPCPEQQIIGQLNAMPPNKRDAILALIGADNGK